MKMRSETRFAAQCDVTVDDDDVRTRSELEDAEETRKFTKKKPTRFVCNGLGKSRDRLRLLRLSYPSTKPQACGDGRRRSIVHVDAGD